MTIPGNLVLYFPSGIYLHTGLTIKKSINIIGENKYSTRLLNIGSQNSIVINQGVERGSVENIAIFGNSTTAKKGFVFNNNSVCWYFNNIWMRNHTEEFFYACNTGNVNNINILNSEFEYGKSTCLKFFQTNFANQINAITISNCNISGFTTGIEAWGQSIKILNNTIQACSEYGIKLDGESEEALSLGHLLGCVIFGNYFELCDKGFIYASATYTPYARYIGGLVIAGNYGSYGKRNADYDESETYLVYLYGKDYDFQVHTISGVFFMSNAFSKGTCKGILKGNNTNTLASSNVINNSTIGNMQTLEQQIGFCNLGHSQRSGFYYSPWQKLYGKTYCLSHNYDLRESENITTNTTIYYHFPIDLLKLQRIKFSCTTDCTNYTIVVVKRVNDTDTNIRYFSNNNGNQDFTHDLFDFSYANNTDNQIDCLGIKVVFTDPVTNFKISNISYRTHD